MGPTFPTKVEKGQIFILPASCKMECGQWSKHSHLKEVIQSYTTDGDYCWAVLEMREGSGSKCSEAPESRNIPFFGFLPLIITPGSLLVLQSSRRFINHLMLFYQILLLNLARAKKISLQGRNCTEKKKKKKTTWYPGKLQLGPIQGLSQSMVKNYHQLLNGKEVEITAGTYLLLYIQLYVNLIRDIGLTFSTNFIIVLITFRVEDFCFFFFPHINIWTRWLNPIICYPDE